MLNFNRRTLIGGLIAGGIGTIAILQTQTEPASASVSMSQLDVAGDDVTTDTGEISNVVVSIQGNWRYAISHGNPQKRKITLSVGKENNWTAIDSLEDSTSVYRGRGNYTISGSVTETKVYSTSNFAVEDRGDSKTVEIPLKVAFEVLGRNDRVLASATIEGVGSVSVSRKEFDASLYGELSGSGSIEIETESD